MDDETRERSADAGTSPPAEAAAEAVAHARAGEVLTIWVNRKLAEGPPAVIVLGTKRATALELLPDGALRVEVAGEPGAQPQPQPQLVALDEGLLEALLRRLFSR